MSDPLRVQVTLALELPEGIGADQYRQALAAAVAALRAAKIKARIEALAFGPTQDMPLVRAEFREPASPSSR